MERNFPHQERGWGGGRGYPFLKKKKKMGEKKRFFFFKKWKMGKFYFFKKKKWGAEIMWRNQ